MIVLFMVLRVEAGWILTIFKVWYGFRLTTPFDENQSIFRIVAFGEYGQTVAGMPGLILAGDNKLYY